MRNFATCLTAMVLALVPLPASAAEFTPVFVGKKYTVDYQGGPSFLLEFKSTTQLDATFLAGPNNGQVLKITYTAKEIVPSIYMLTWQEADKATVVHVDDFSRMVSYSNLTLPDGTFHNTVGRLANAP